MNARFDWFLTDCTAQHQALVLPQTTNGTHDDAGVTSELQVKQCHFRHGDGLCFSRVEPN